MFSIVTVVLNDRAGLIRTHESLRSQSDRRFEWLVLDGGSIDGTAEYVEEHCTETAWWRSQPDGGPYDGMNAGLDRASGEYVLFLNAGDTLAGPETLARIATAIDGMGRPDFVYGDAFERAPDGTVTLKPARSHRHAWYGMFTHHQAMLYRREVLAGRRYPLDYRIGSDYALTLEVLRDKPSIGRLDLPVCIFEQGGLANRQASTGRLDQFRIRQKALGMGWPLNAGIMALQAASFALRRAAPSLYSRLRFRRFSRP